MHLFYVLAILFVVYVVSSLFLLFLQKNYIFFEIKSDIFCPPLLLLGPCIVLEKKVFRGGDTFYCPTGVDAEVTSSLPEDE